jgi:hypothetical protein
MQSVMIPETEVDFCCQYLGVSSDSIYLYRHLMEQVSKRKLSFSEFTTFGWNRYGGDGLLYRAKMAQNDIVAIYGLLTHGLPFLPGHDPEEESGEASGEEASIILQDCGVDEETASLCQSCSWGFVEEERLDSDESAPLVVEESPVTEEEE